MNSNPHSAYHLMVRGRVQGVGFRAWCKANARRRGLQGWVRNRSDKTVELVIAGTLDMLDDMVEACADGPLASRVLSVEVNGWAFPVEDGFIIRETYQIPADEMPQIRQQQSAKTPEDSTV